MEQHAVAAQKHEKKKLKQQQEDWDFFWPSEDETVQMYVSQSKDELNELISATES